VSSPGVAVIVPAFQAERTLPALLAALAGQDADIPFETIVVDDGSTDDTGRIAREAGARVIRQDNAGPAAARNRGWRASSARVLLFTDADCVPRSDWVRRLADALDDEHEVAGGTYAIANPGYLLAEAVHAEIAWRHARLPEDVEFAGSFNLAATRRALETVGGFDETYPAASAEDNDLSYRLRDAGFRIRFARDAVVAHHHPVRLGGYLKEQMRHGYWRVVLYRKHPARAGGDGYAGFVELAAPPLAMLSLALPLLAPWVPTAPGLAILAFVAVLFIHSRLALVVAAQQHTDAALALLPVGTLRAYARGLGMLRALPRLWRRPPS